MTVYRVITHIDFPKIGVHHSFREIRLFMEEDKSLAASMEQTIEYGNLDFLGELGEIMIDTALNDGVLKEIPILGTIVGVSKCIKNVYDIRFAKKLVAFLIPIRDVAPEQRAAAIKKWEQDKNYRGKVGDTLLGMIERCDDTVKAAWLSKLFYELVLKHNWPRLFMRAEKTLSSLSVMDVQAFLNMPKDHYHHIKEDECEPFIGSGLYLNPKLESSNDERLDLDNKYCAPSEIGMLIYNVLNDISIPKVEQHKLF